MLDTQNILLVLAAILVSSSIIVGWFLALADMRQDVLDKQSRFPGYKHKGEESKGPHLEDEARVTPHLE